MARRRSSKPFEPNILSIAMRASPVSSASSVTAVRILSNASIVLSPAKLDREIPSLSRPMIASPWPSRASARRFWNSDITSAAPSPSIRTRAKACCKSSTSLVVIPVWMAIISTDLTKLVAETAAAVKPAAAAAIAPKAARPTFLIAPKARPTFDLIPASPRVTAEESILTLSVAPNAIVSVL